MYSICCFNFIQFLAWTDNIYCLCAVYIIQIDLHPRKSMQLRSCSILQIFFNEKDGQDALQEVSSKPHKERRPNIGTVSRIIPSWMSWTLGLVHSRISSMANFSSSCAFRATQCSDFLSTGTANACNRSGTFCWHLSQTGSLNCETQGTEKYSTLACFWQFHFRF